MSGPLDFVGHVVRESARFHDCLAGVDPTTAVPTCPDWTAADLVWHLAEVQLFWSAIVRERLDDPTLAEEAKPPRPDDYPSLLALLASATGGLVDALGSTPPETAVWTWATDHTAGFVRRRQAHEALIHRLDAELTAGAVTGFDAALATDGVDEALRVMFGDPPSWGVFAPSVVTGRVTTIDTAVTWGIQLGRFAGTSPNTGKTYDEASLTVVVVALSAPSFVVEGSARNLDAWLWGRELSSVLDVHGDPRSFGELEAVVGRGVD